MARFRARSFRASVVTVAAAFAPGCDDPNVTSSCPVEAPEEGDPCRGSLTCPYMPLCNGRFPVLDAVCVSGAFELRRSSCNPPWDGGPWDAGSRDAGPDPALSSCPAQLPAEGQSCVAGLACGYAYNEICSGYTQFARCVSGRIQRSISTCNPPGPRLDGSVDGAADSAPDSSTGDGASGSALTSDAMSFSPLDGG